MALLQGKQWLLCDKRPVHVSSADISKDSTSSGFNPLPHMPISGSSDSAANKDMMSKIRTNEDTII